MSDQSTLQNFFVLTFGCQMNTSDSDVFSKILKDHGLKDAATIEEADLLIINTCSVRQKAEDRIVGLRKKIESLRQNKPNLITVLTGCMARRSWQDTSKLTGYGKSLYEKRIHKLKKDMPWLNEIVETTEFYKLPNLLGLHSINSLDEVSLDSLNQDSKSTHKNISGYVSISAGCDHFCSFCIVPYARGKEVCKPAKQIIKEFELCIKAGNKDITLLGQTVNRWINPDNRNDYTIKNISTTYIPEINKTSWDGLTEPKDFLQLLQKLDSFEGNYWINYVSSHPNYMTKELIDFIASSKHIRPYFHLALQSGSNEMLKRMNRGYTIESFSEIAKYYKEKLPLGTLSTDIIVGYPKESEAEFQLTVKAMQELEFDMAFLSEFSSRKGTAAALIKDDIPNETKAKRKMILNDEVLAVTALNNNKKLIGKNQKVLIYKHFNGYIVGRTEGNKEIKIKIPSHLKKDEYKNLLPNNFIDVEVISCTSWALEGKL